MSFGKVSIVIPTRDRADTLEYAIATATTQDYPDVEIIVSDNASGPETLAVVERFSDPRIRYVNTGSRVSMSDNFEFALSHVEGDWIVVIGDDDGILPSGITRALAALADTGLEALGSVYGHFRWPEPDGSSPEMFLWVPRGKGYSVRDARKHIDRVLRSTRGFTCSPMLYTGGVIHRSIYERLKNQTGRFFHSRTPDVYSAFAICSVIDKFVLLREPVMIGGVSRHSHGWNPDGAPAELFWQERNIPYHWALAAEETDNLASMLPALIYECHLQCCAAQNVRSQVDPAYQLRSALAAGGSKLASHEFRERWSRRFCELHGLSLDEREAPLHEKISRRMTRWYHGIADLIGPYRIDESYGFRHETVLDAVKISEWFIQERPSFLDNLVRSARRKLRTWRNKPAHN